MLFKKLLIVSMFILVLAIGTVSASQNITDEAIAQDTSQDNPVNSPVNGTSFSDVQSAVDSSKKNDVIELEGYFSGSRKEISIKKDLTIQASPKGATLDGKKLSSVFNIKANVTLKNLMIKNSADSAIVVTDCDYCIITIINCTFLHNGGTDCSSGGAISSNMGELHIYNSTFDANKAGIASAIWYYDYYNQQSEIVNCTFKNHPSNTIDTGGDLRIINSTFENNGGSESSGGAIYSLDTLYIENTRFINNQAMCGGAIYSAWSNLTVVGCVFDKNTAADGGGTIYSNSVIYSDDVIIENIKISNTNISNSKAGKLGGAICSYLSNIELANTKITTLNTFEDIYLDIGGFKATNSTYNGIKWNPKHRATLTAAKLTTTYDSRTNMKFSMFDEDDKHSLEERQLIIKVFTGKASKTYVRTIYDDDYFVGAVLEITRDFGLGKHKVEVTSLSKYYEVKKLTTYLTINKAKTTVKAPKVTSKYKKSKKFSLTVKNKASGYKVANIKVKIKVFTGKKSKTYIVKTDKKGVASINVKKLKKGTHKVKITSADKNYSISKTSKIIIK